MLETILHLLKLKKKKKKSVFNKDLGITICILNSW